MARPAPADRRRHRTDRGTPRILQARRRRNRRERHYSGARPSPPRSRAVRAYAAGLLSSRSRVAASAAAHRARTYRARRLPLPPREPGGAFREGRHGRAFNGARGDDPRGLHRLPVLAAGPLHADRKSGPRSFVSWPGCRPDRSTVLRRYGGRRDFTVGMRDPVRGIRHYPFLSASNGSTRVARRAGM